MSRLTDKEALEYIKNIAEDIEKQKEREVELRKFDNQSLYITFIFLILIVIGMTIWLD